MVLYLKSPQRVPMKQIVLIDDNAVSCRIVEEILKPIDYRIAIFQSGKEGIAYLQEHDADLILLDVLMPVMDGLQTCKRIKQIAQHQETPVIFLTVKYDERTIHDAYSVGGVDYITKPFHCLELLARMQTHLQLNEQKAALKAHNETLQKLVDEEVKKSKKQDLMLMQRHKLIQMGEMAEMIAHQWKQPLNAISLYVAEMMVEDQMHHFDALKAQDTTGFYGKSLGVFKNIERQVEYLKDTVQTFNTFYQPQMESRYFFIEEALNVMQQLLAASLDNYGIALKLQLVQNVALQGNENSLVQVLMTLVNNAKDALKSSQITQPQISVSVSEVINQKIEMIVEDNGNGIDPSIEETLFDEFVTTKGTQEGSGLGLYIAKMIIEEQFNGTIYLTHGTKGARFVIELPVSRS